MQRLYEHYAGYAGAWLWKHFTPKEFSCRHCGEYYHDPAALDLLQGLRDVWAKPIVITSGHRCKEHNDKVGGAVASQHLTLAFDCVCLQSEQARFVKAAKVVGFRGIGRYPYRNFVHLDCASARQWTDTGGRRSGVWQ